MIKLKSKNEKVKTSRAGFTLVETIVAVGVISVGFVGTLVILSRSSSQADILKDRIIAAHLAEEGIEVVRNIRDSNWLEPSSGWRDGLADTANAIVSYDSESLTIEPDSAKWCLTYVLIETDGFYKYKHAISCNTTFKRHIVLTTKTMESYPWESDPAKLEYLEIKSVVTWEEKGQTKTITAIDNFYDWR